MTERDKLIELLTGKSIDTPIDVEYVVDYLLENGVILSPVKVGDAVCMIQENNIVKLYVNYIEIGINNTDTDITVLAMQKGDSFADYKSEQGKILNELKSGL